MIKILAIDQSMTGTAYAIFGMHSFCLEFFDAARIRSKTKGIYRIDEITSKIRSLVSDLDSRPSILCREMHSFSMTGSGNAVHELNGVIDQIALHAGYCDLRRYLRITPGTWKKFCTGKGNIAKDTAYLMKLNKFFNKQSWWDHGEVEDDNIADAICLGVTAAYLYVYQHYVCESSEFSQSDVPMFDDLTKVQQAVLKDNAEKVFFYRGEKL